MPTLQELESKVKNAFINSDLPLPDKQVGKVRESYRLPHQQRLFITTDRLSAFDLVLAGVPYKGQVLNQLAAWWFEQTKDIIPNHLISLPDPNAIIALEAKPFPVEVIVRGYLTGVTKTSIWYRYVQGEREIYGYQFPDGLEKNQRLPEPIITPTTKAEAGQHDEILTCEEVVSRNLLDADKWQNIQKAALSLFERGQKLAAKAGLKLVDTKYEFGLAPDGRILLIDEIHTPDSSRFWLGEDHVHYDKEWVRLAYVAQNYRGEGEPPKMTDHFWAQTAERYIRAYELLTGQQFNPGQYPVNSRLKLNLQHAGVLNEN